MVPPRPPTTNKRFRIRFAAWYYSCHRDNAVFILQLEHAAQDEADKQVYAVVVVMIALTVIIVITIIAIAMVIVAVSC